MVRALVIVLVWLLAGSAQAQSRFDGWASAIIAADGRLLATVPHLTAGAAEAPLPAALPPTVFSRLGNMLALAVAMALAAIGVAIRRRAR